MCCTRRAATSFPARRGRQGGRRRVSELATRSDAFCIRWAAHDVRLHHTGTKRFRHPSSATSPSPPTRWNSPPTPAQPDTTAGKT